MEAHLTNLVTPGKIDSIMKLQVLLLFQRHPSLCRSVRAISEWICTSPWALEEALEALVDLGMLRRVSSHQHPHYLLDSNHEYSTALSRLVEAYEDPLTRDELLTLVRAAHQERQYLDCHGGYERAVGERSWNFA